MTGRLAVACTLVLIALLGYLGFPGHTYLQSDTQIYVPMLEHIRDPGVLDGDIAASRPHLAYTAYDEIALALRPVGVPFEYALQGQQLLFRGLQALGIYLLALAMPLARWQALVVAAVAGLGASISGPSVLLLEYEPIPRGFALALVFLAAGLAATGRLNAASWAGSAAFLYHAPTTIPFWLCFFVLIVHRRAWSALLPVAAATWILLVMARLQPGLSEPQPFFDRIDPEWERLERLRASYNWVSTWAVGLAPRYLFYWALSLLALWRIRPGNGRIFLACMPVIGLLSVPASFVLLERWKWSLMPQVQPARALLFVTAFTLILSTVAALRAGHWLESVAWFIAAFSIPMRGFGGDLTAGQIGLAAALGFASVLLSRWRLGAAPALAAYLLIAPNHQPLETPGLRGVEQFAREHTGLHSVFLFPNVGHGLEPGLFRARALRPVYVDWKSGGQVNYYRSVAIDWWFRWQQTGELRPGGLDAAKLAGLGVNYVVVTKDAEPRALEQVYGNASYVVYRLPGIKPGF